MKKTLIVILSLLFCLCALVACQHTDEWSQEWSSNATHHWHDCLAEGCENQGELAEHSGGTATCTQKAKCSVCNVEYGDLAGHIFNQEVANEQTLATPATCLAEATYYKTCVCGQKGTETFASGAKAAHTPAQTWSKDENQHWHDCTVENCNNKVDLADHIYDQQVVDVAYLKSEATCSSASLYYKSCVCGAKGTETFAHGEPNGQHVFDYDNAQLVQEGENQHKIKCQACDAYSAPVNCAPANADNDCTTAEVCACGRQLTAAESNHNLTWQQVGDQHKQVCQNENCSYESALEICSVGTEGTPATCSLCAVCGVCGQSFGQVDATAHNFGSMNLEVPATCSATGTKAYKDCSLCNKHFDEEGAEIADLTIAIDANAHNFGSLIAEVPATCSATGTKAHKDCSLCNKHFDEEGAEIADLTIAIDANAHNFGSFIAEVPATCSATGTKAHKDCSLCNKHFDEEGAEIADLTIAIDEHAHNYVWDKTGADVDVATCSLNEEHTLTINKVLATEPALYRLWVASYIGADNGETGAIANTIISTITERLGVEETVLATKKIQDLVFGEDVALNKNISCGTLRDSRQDLHGYQDLIITVAGLDGETHDFRMPLLLVTGGIGNTTDFMDKAYPASADMYGCYIITTQIDIKDWNIQNSTGGKYSSWAAAATDYSFKGTLIGWDNGTKAPTARTINSQNRLGGLLGKMSNATLSNLVIVDTSSNGCNIDDRNLLADSIENSKFINVEFVVNKAHATYYSTDGKGWLTDSASNVSFTNCMFKNETESGMPVLLTATSANVTFENCQYQGNILATDVLAKIAGQSKTATDLGITQFVVNEDVE